LLTSARARIVAICGAPREPSEIRAEKRLNGYGSSCEALCACLVHVPCVWHVLASSGLVAGAWSSRSEIFIFESRTLKLTPPVGKSEGTEKILRCPLGPSAGVLIMMRSHVNTVASTVLTSWRPITPSFCAPSGECYQASNASAGRLCLRATCSPGVELRCRSFDLEQTPAAIACGHHFCRHCIQKHLYQTAWCPVCRAPATPKSLRPLHDVASREQLLVRCDCGTQVALRAFREHADACSTRQARNSATGHRDPGSAAEPAAPSRSVFQCPFCSAVRMPQDDLLSHLQSAHAQEVRPVAPDPPPFVRFSAVPPDHRHAFQRCARSAQRCPGATQPTVLPICFTTFSFAIDLTTVQPLTSLERRRMYSLM
jgi:hypothetical protein